MTHQSQTPRRTTKPRAATGRPGASVSHETR